MYGGLSEKFLGGLCVQIRRWDDTSQIRCWADMICAGMTAYFGVGCMCRVCRWAFRFDGGLTYRLDGGLTGFMVG